MNTNDIAEKLFPAHAGVILDVSHYQEKINSFPCTRRGDPVKRVFVTNDFNFSLHTQG